MSNPRCRSKSSTLTGNVGLRPAVLERFPQEPRKRVHSACLTGSHQPPALCTDAQLLLLFVFGRALKFALYYSDRRFARSRAARPHSLVRSGRSSAIYLRSDSSTPISRNTNSNRLTKSRYSDSTTHGTSCSETPSRANRFTSNSTYPINTAMPSSE